MDERRQEIEAFFRDENDSGEHEEETSPSGRFRLAVRHYHTRPGAWMYTRGTVTRIADGKVICDIKRNYSVFHHTFVERGGHEWLITGRSYMSQTLVDLDGEKEYEPPGDHYVSHAFCWAAAFVSADGSTLAIDGCRWACPYEYRFFDFTDASRGWPELPVASGETLEVVGEKRPVWHADGTFECFETGGDEVVARRRLRRDGQAMVVVEYWIADAERARREDAERRAAELEERIEQFKRSDPLFMGMLASVPRHALSDGDDILVGGHPADDKIVVRRYLRRGEPRTSLGHRVGCAAPRR